MSDLTIMDRIKKHLENVEYSQGKIEEISKAIVDLGAEIAAGDESAIDHVENLKIVQDGYRFRVLAAGDRIRDLVRLLAE